MLKFFNDIKFSIKLPYLHNWYGNIKNHYRKAAELK